MKKLIIFDLDGTLMDTLEDLKNSANYALKAFNLPLISLEDTRKAIGNGTPTLMKRLSKNVLDSNDEIKLHDTFFKHYKIHYADHTKPYANVLKTIRKIKEKGYLTAVVSNKDTPKVIDLVNKFFPSSFDKIIGTSEDIPKKPNPKGCYDVLTSLNITSCEALYIGDTEVDVETATNANIECLLVSYGYRTKKELIQLVPNTPIIDNILDLLKIL